MDKMIKYFRAEIKSIDEEKYEALVKMSDQTIDSYNEIVDASGWKKHLGRFKKHPVLLSSHNYRTLRNQIGTTLKIFVKDEALWAQLKYFDIPIHQHFHYPLKLQHNLHSL